MMIEQLLDVGDATPLPEMQARLGDVLGLARPVPMPVLLRAIDDPGFASDLITCRQSPDFLTALFDDSRTRAYAPTVDAATHSTGALAGKAASALVRWGKAGFSTVDPETLERRETACLSCPNLTEPGSLLQKMVPVGHVTDAVGSRLGRRVCGLCGCTTTKKIRLPSDSCPDDHPVRVGFTRWGEPAVVARGVE